MFGVFGRALMKLARKGKDWVDTRDWQETAERSGEAVGAVGRGIQKVGRVVRGAKDQPDWRDADRSRRQRISQDSYAPFEAAMRRREDDDS